MDTDFLLYELRRRWWPQCSAHLNIFNLMSSCFSCISQYQLPIRQVTVLMVGLDNAGKTSTVKGLLKVPLEEMNPTVGCARTELRVDNFLVTVLDVGGGPAARKTWRDHYGKAHGIIFVLDSSDRLRAREAKELLEDLLKQPRVADKPLLVLANKQDKMNAMLGSELTEALSLEKMINHSRSLCHIEPCSALLDTHRLSDRKTLKGLRWLLRAVCLDYTELCARVAWDSRQPVGHEEREGERGGRAERGQDKPKEEKIHNKKAQLFSKKSRKKEKKTPKKKPVDKLQPIRNILTKESTVKRKLKKKKQVKIIDNVKKRHHRKEEEEEEQCTEAETDQSGHKDEKYTSALLPGDRARPKRKAKEVREEKFPRSDENEDSNLKKGTGQKGNRRRTVKIKRKNKINTEEVAAMYSQPVDLSETFDLYRETILSLKARQDQGN